MIDGKYVLHRAAVDHIPVIWCEPAEERRTGNVAIWLSGLGGRKENLAPYLADLADRGFIAISFDAYDHGERMRGTPDEFRSRLERNKRRYFWPIMAHTIDEIPRVLDWAAEHLGANGKAMAGGISMGGDIAVAAGGLDRRIVCAAACISTPDWLRPGTDESPSEPDTMAWNGYRRFNPLANLERYAHCPAIVFENGAQDGHVPPDGARRFAQLLLGSAYAGCPERIAVHEHPVGHEMIPAMWQGALAWFAQHA